MFGHTLLLTAYPMTDSENKNVSPVFLPAVLREVEKNERQQQTVEDIKMWLRNSG